MCPDDLVSYQEPGIKFQDCWPTVSLSSLYSAASLPPLEATNSPQEDEAGWRALA